MALAAPVFGCQALPVAMPVEGGGGRSRRRVVIDLASQIERLVQLHTAGILSDEELAKAKAKLLS